MGQAAKPRKSTGQVDASEAGGGESRTPSGRKVVRRARELLREATRLLKRRRRHAHPSGVERVEGDVAALQALLPPRGSKGVDAAQAWSATLRLDEAVDEHFGRWRKTVLREYVESIVWAVALALVIRVTLFEAFSIPSGSMLPTLEIGDHLFVNKVAMGLYVPFSASRYVHWGEPQRGDIIVFEFRLKGNVNDGEDYIKRVVATAGDRVRLVDNVLHVNGAPIPTERLTPDDPAYAEMCPIYNRDGVSEPYHYCPCERQRERMGPGDDRAAWSTEVISQHWLPNGDILCIRNPDWAFDELDPHERERYRSPACRLTNLAALGEVGKQLRAACLEQHPDGAEMVVPPGHLFVMGDNRDQSEDGRAWGLVPYDRIKGTAFFIWYAENFSRIFTWLD